MNLSIRKNRLYEFLPHGLVDWSAFVLCLLFFAIRDIPVLLYGGQIIAVPLIIWINRRKTPVSYLMVWAAFITWCLLTTLWASDINHAGKFLREILQVGIVSISLYIFSRTIDDQSKLLNYITACSLVMMVYFVIKTPISEWRSTIYSNQTIASSYDRFGRTIGMHPNTFGTLCSLLAMIWVYQWRTTQSKASLICCTVFIVLLLFTKSRASLLFLAVMALVFWLSEKRKPRKVLARLFVALLLLSLALWLLLNNRFLYQLVGYRVSGVIAFVTGEGIVDSSISGRNLLIEAGKEMIRDYPFFGVGAGNFSNNAFDSYGIWRDVYAHNNYIEMWADLGIIGLLLYYIPRFWCCIELLKIRKRLSDEEAPLCALLLAIAIGTLVTDNMKISYEKEPQQILFGLQFAYCVYMKKRVKPVHSMGLR